MSGYLRTTVLMAGLTAIFMGLGYMLGGAGGMVVALAVAAGMNVFAWWNSDKMVLRMHEAVPVPPGDAGGLHAMLARLAARADMPVPALYLLRTDQPNAFATGRNPQNAAVAVTEGLLRRLSPDEVEGVIAHELAHIRNHDTAIMTVTATFAGAISMLANFALFFGGRRDSPLGLVGTIAMALLAPLAAMLVQMAISRTREYAADRAAAGITGKPMALAAALRAIQGAAARIDNNTAERNPATAHMFIINPLHAHGHDKLFSTHPATENRIAALMALAGETGPASRIVPDRRPASAPAAKGPWG